MYSGHIDKQLKWFCEEEDRLEKETGDLQKRVRELEHHLSYIRKLRDTYKEWEAIRDKTQLALPGASIGISERISYKKGLALVMREAQGKPLHALEIWRRMQQIGVRSKSERPEGFVSLHAKYLPQIQKVAPKTYQWVEDESDA